MAEGEVFAGEKKRRLDWYDWSTALSHSIPALLSRGLSKRATRVTAFLSPLADWAVSATPTPSLHRTLTVGLCLDPPHAQSLVDHGPPADDAERVQEFKELWGQKAELRRFKDGSILQASVWENLKDRRNLIVQSAVAYLLKLHFGLGAAAFSYYAAQFDRLLVDPRLTRPADAFTKPIHAFEQLLRQLKSLDLPLSISSVHAVSPSLRSTEVFIPQSTEEAGGYPGMWAPLLDVVLQFESSGHWPDDLEAIRHTKTAFYLRMADELQSQLSLDSTVAADWIEIPISGFTFRLVIHHERELLLLRNAGDQKAIKKVATPLFSLVSFFFSFRFLTQVFPT